MQSYRCKNFSFKQVSGLIGEGGSGPPHPPPGSATALVPFDILSTPIDARSELETQSLYKTADKIKEVLSAPRAKTGEGNYSFL